MSYEFANNHKQGRDVACNVCANMQCTSNNYEFCI